MTRSIRFLALIVTAGLLGTSLTAAAAATERDEGGPRGSERAEQRTSRSEHAAPLAVIEAHGFDVLGSVRQAAVIGATPGSPVELRDATDTVVASGVTDSLGGFLARELDAGEGYTFTVGNGTVGDTTSAPFTVLDDPLLHDTPHPDASFYASLPELPVNGYGYMEMRDGVTLGVQTQLPGPVEDGPYPTVVEYSGYDPSNPANNSNLFKIAAGLLGYAYVGVNVRGSGCSGGAFWFFEHLQSLDGYDVIESVGAQDWSANIGMVGISYPAIAQLFTAQTQPPSLTAIAPVSVLDDVFRGTLYPGGIFNDGFALSWATDRETSNRWPNGAGWVRNRVNAGDAQCADNVRLRGQNQDLLADIEANPYFPAPGNPQYPHGADPLTPYHFVRDITVPTFMSGAWQDEQTGGHWPYLLENLVSMPDGTLKVNLYNGAHADALQPELFGRMLEFLDFYVAERVPTIPPDVRLVAPVIFQQAFGIPGLTLPPDRFTDFTSHDAALAAYEAEPVYRVLWENGAGGSLAGAPIAVGDSTFDQWPVPSSATTFFLHGNGSLAEFAPADETVASYVSDASVRARRNYSGGNSGLWVAQPNFAWSDHVEGNTLVYETSALGEPLTIVGPGSLDLWLRSSASDTDIQVTMTEVYPDGNERYVQSGWLRASQRALDEQRSTATSPVPTHLEADSAPLPAGAFTKVRVPLFPVGHVFHSGSKLRILVSAPGGDRPLWSFDTIAAGETNEIAHSAVHPSALVLPVVENPDIPDVAPPCPSLRLQPCRTAGFVTPEPQSATIAGRVLGPDNAPLSGAVVMAYTSTDSWLGTGYAVTGADGTYEMTVPPGEYRVMLRGTPEGTQVVEWYDHSPTRADAHVLTLGGGDAATGIDAKLAPGGWITGTVTLGGEPLAGVQVWAFDDDDRWVGTAAGTTGADGTYRIAGLPEGDYRILFRPGAHPELANQWWDATALRRDAPHVSVTWNQHVADIDAEFDHPIVPAFVPGDCWWSLPGAFPSNVTITCGTVDVPENRSDPGSRAITLAVALLEPDSADSDAAPVIRLHGGPGGSSLAGAPTGHAQLAAQAGRSIVLFDQRGSGRSTPSLKCPERKEAIVETLTKVVGFQEMLASNRASAVECYDRLVAEGHDLNQYHSLASAADMDALREIFAGEEWHVWGGSYGAGLGLVYARAYPDRVRSLVPDSPYPPNEGSLPGTMSLAPAALDRLVDECNNDPACSTAFGDLGAHLDTAIASFDANPAVQTQTIVVDGVVSERTFVLNGADVRAGLFAALYDAALIPLLPSIIFALAHGDRSIIPAFIAIGIPRLTEYSEGHQYSVECADNGSTFGDTDLLSSLPEDHEDAMFLVTIAVAYCEVWDVDPLPASFVEPVTVDVPTLLFGGTLDPVTPYHFAVAQRDVMPNARLVTVPRGGHGVARFNACTTSALIGFWNDPAADLPACVDSIPAAPFVTP